MARRSGIGGGRTSGAGGSTVLPLVATDPVAPAEGQLWARTDTLQPRVYLGGQVIDLVSAVLPRCTPGRWYPTQTGGTNTNAVTANRAYAIPFTVPRQLTLDGIAIDITTNATAGNARAGLYLDDGGLSPGNRAVVDYGTVSITTNGVKTWTVSTVLAPFQPYWVVITAQGVTGSPAWRVISGAQQWIADTAATPSMGVAQNAYYTDTGFTGAYPGSFGALAGVTNGPRVSVKVA